ncbi:hypothetical protein [Parasphaerochaeta coccoides]|uniref:Lipoprotein n=1 Tax=Parasphaerochaeta coccoides (strain ATCC BAA-1237 / DSM 17374 / SPN1) TaxID=760011 RepID=F4GLT0_PARC1|nr:hypothetical protein [Parasphaerochaeta coccoides]AEC02474.1 hypothetical protein Spico_1265 [Parasphaerochaeta coccoides DSM 17374]
MINKNNRLYFLLLIFLPLMVVISGCNMDYRYKILLEADIYRDPGRNLPPAGSPDNPIIIAGNYDKDTVLQAAKDVMIGPKYSLSSTKSRTLEEFMLDGLVHFQYFLDSDPDGVVFLFSDEYGEAYFIIHFKAEGAFIGDIKDWEIPPGSGGPWLGGAS